MREHGYMTFSNGARVTYTGPFKTNKELVIIHEYIAPNQKGEDSGWYSCISNRVYVCLDVDGNRTAIRSANLKARPLV